MRPANQLFVRLKSHLVPRYRYLNVGSATWSSAVRDFPKIQAYTTVLCESDSLDEINVD